MQSASVKTIADDDHHSLSNVCQDIRARFSSAGLEYFEDTPILESVIPFILANDWCGFLIDRVRETPVRDFHRMANVKEDLMKDAPGSRCFGILVVDDDDARQFKPFTTFCAKRDVVFMKSEMIGDFIGKTLKLPTGKRY